MMHSLEWIQGALGVLVGFAVTRIAVSCVHMFMARANVRLAWIPFAWAAIVFVALLQFAWTFALIEGDGKPFGFGAFLMLLSLVLALFVAAALVLPNTESQSSGDLMLWHRANGRYALPFLAAYAVMAYPLEWRLLGWTPLSNPGPAALAVLALVAFASPSPRALNVSTALCLIAVGGLLVQLIATS